MILLPSSGFFFHQAMASYIALVALSAVARLFLAQSALMKCASAIRAFLAHSGSAVLATILEAGTAFKYCVPNGSHSSAPATVPLIMAAAAWSMMTLTYWTESKGIPFFSR